MKIQGKEIIKYIRDTITLINSSSYYGNKLVVKSFLQSIIGYIRVLSEIESLVIKGERMESTVFNSDCYKEMISSISDKLIIKAKLKKCIFNLARLERIKELMKVNTFEIQLEYSKAVDMRIGLILIIFNYYLLAYQINNMTIEYCNQMALMNLVDILSKYLSVNTLFPMNIPNKLKGSFTNSIEFKALLIQNRELVNKE